LVGQTNIAKVKIGQNVAIRPDPYKDKEFEGTVTRVDQLGHNIAGVVTYNVYIQLKNPDELLKPEMTIDGDIITNERKDVLTVPNSAVVLYKGEKTVRVIKGNSIDYLPVKIGIKGETLTEIVEGVKEGQQIIVALSNEKVKRPNPLGL
jgi:multidrug efflux pump subunit AcrA (membrane-fusion protein)